MSSKDLIVWEHGDRVITPRGPATVTRPAHNPWASTPPVRVRLDADGSEWEFIAQDLTPENPEELTNPTPRPCAHERPILSMPGEPLACGACNYCGKPYAADSDREEQR